MPLLLTLAILVNVALFAFGQGFFGTPPVEQGRDPRPLSQRNQTAITLDPPLATHSEQP
ncbi:hypothetical protein [Castellaniella sp. GW247-6E4]|uniref:hypothetical protein n=1 Tax=Castellaniella sp. GW247-6E4 TaxID=3140380 RepID=UPI003314C87D